MRRSILFIAALIGTTSSAETIGTVQPVASGAKVPSHYVCHKIDARSGWQRLDTSQLSTPSVFPMGPRAAAQYGFSGPDGKPGWSVDAANYDAVGPRGHAGDAAAALKPFDGYKFSQDYPFGALLLRFGSSGVVHLYRTDNTTSLESYQPWVDFRINDTGFGDNAGYMIVCVTDLSNFN